MAGPTLDRLRRVDQTLLDTGLAVVLAAITLLSLWTAPPTPAGQPGLLASVLALVMTLPLAFRRQRPVLVLAVIVVATIAAAITGPSSGVGLGVVIAVYSVAAHAERRHSLAALALTMAAATIVVLLVVASTAVDLPPATLPLGLVLAWMIFGGVWLLGDLVRSRGDAVAELRQRNAELEVEREENARLAVADERARIARELHDVVAHSLSVMVVQAGAARRALETGEPDSEAAAERARGALTAIESTGRDTLGEMRRVVGALRPSGDDGYEPQPSLDALDRLLTSVREAGLPVDLVVHGEARPVPRSIDLAAYRVIQEALTNSLKHARATSARVGLCYGQDALEVEVTDDGRGAAARLLEAPHHGYGLAGMRERVALVNGEIVAEPGLAGGFVVRARLPLGRLP